MSQTPHVLELVRKDAAIQCKDELITSEVCKKKELLVDVGRP